MPQIPTGAGRRVMPGDFRAPNVSPESFGAQVGRAAEGIGATFVHSATLDLRDQTREAQAQAEASARQRDLLALQQGQDALRDAHDEIADGVNTGTIPKDQAEATATARFKNVIGQTVKNVRPETQDLAMRDLDGLSLRMGNSLRKVVQKRDQSDIRSGIDQTLEYQSRQYATDPAKATAMVNATLSELGPYSGWTPEELQRKGQGWRESTEFTQGYEAVSAGRNDRKALDAAEQLISGKLPNLDPQKKATLLDRIGAYRLAIDQRDELGRQRALREEERRLNRAQAEFQVFQTMADKGTVLDPAYIDNALSVTAGTPYQAGIRALAQQQAETGGLAAQTIGQQQRLLDGVNAEIARNGRNPALDKRKEQVEKVLRGSISDFEKDPLRAGLERGVITQIEPLDFSKGMGGVAQQLQDRAVQAQRVATWATRAPGAPPPPVSPLTNEEAGAMKQQLDALPPKERSAAVATFAGVLGQFASQGLATQLDKKDKALGLAFAFAGAKTTEGRYTSELVLRGAAAKQDGTSTKNEKQPDLKVAQWSARIATELEGVFPAQTLTDQTREAALLISHAIAAEGGGKLSEKDLDRAVGLAVGGHIVDHNDRKVALPAGIDEDMLNKRLRSVSVEELNQQAPGGQVRAGGVPMATEEFVKTLPGQQLMYAGPGKYTVIVGGRPVLNEAGRPIIIGVQ